jgi:hypothetical protein
MNPVLLRTPIADCLLRNEYSVWLIMQLEQVVMQWNAISLQLFYGSTIYTPVCLFLYRIICKSLRDVRHLQYSSRGGHSEGEHVNRWIDTPGFCPTVQVCDMSFLLCLSWLLCSRFRKFWKDLWIILYISLCIHNPSGMSLWGSSISVYVVGRAWYHRAEGNYLCIGVCWR